MICPTWGVRMFGFTQKRSPVFRVGCIDSPVTV